MMRDYLELVRAPAALSVPGDPVAGAAAAGALGPQTVGAVASSVCLYWAGMAANDWADRSLDAAQRPSRPIPSGRVPAPAAIAVAGTLTAGGLLLAGFAGGRRTLAVAAPLAGTVWAYDLWLKQTAAGPAAMAACRGLNVLLGAAGRGAPRAVPAALIVAAHTYTVTALSRAEVDGASRRLPAATLAATAGVAACAAASPLRGRAALRRGTGSWSRSPSRSLRGRPQMALRGRRSTTPLARRLAAPGVEWALAAWYAAEFGAAQLRAVREPTAGRIRAAVGTGITSLPALQGALAARSGAGRLALLVAAAAPLGRRLARKVSPT
jgi:4-hydroxybenzoate polyprenyltransferase